jgi:oligopeptide transport system substrate-binding protein
MCRLRFATFFVLVASLGAQTVLHVPVGGPPVTFDPHLMPAPFPFHAQFVMQIFEAPLETRVDDKGLLTVVPALCDLPVIAKDGLRVTMRVRKGARFQDDPCFEGGKGREVTAKDVAYSLLRHADPAVKPAASSESPAFQQFIQGRFKGVDAWREAAQKLGKTDYDAPPEGIRAEGDDVVLELLAPCPQLRALFTQPWACVVAREAVSKYGHGSDHPVGTGPFRLGDVDAARVRLLRNPTYRIPGLPKVDELRLDIVPDPAKQASRWLAGDLDILTITAATEKGIVDKNQNLLDSLKKHGCSLIDGVPLSVSYLVFNMASPVLGKLEVREALTLALDRDAVSREGQGPRVGRADYPLPVCVPEAAQIRLDPWPLAKRDVAQAKARLAKAGFGDPARPLELILDVPMDQPPDPRGDRAAAMMVAQLGEAGIKATLRKEAFEKFLERAARGDVHLAWVSWYADYPDAEDYLLLFRSEAISGGDWGSNYGHYSDPKVDALYVRVGNRLPGPERTSDVTEILRKVRADCAWIPLSFPAPVAVLGKGVDGYRANVLNYSLRDVGKKP